METQFPEIECVVRIRHVNLHQRIVAFPRKTLPTFELSYILKSKRLRSLDLSHTGIELLPRAISKLKQLGYLNLSHTNITHLPVSVYKLLNLKILNLECCTKFRRFAYGIVLMLSLRHLLLSGCSSLDSMPTKLGELTYLRTLSMFVVPEEVRGDQLGELKSLNLGGKLEIRHLERIRSHLDAMNANLVNKPKIHDLVLHWGDNIASEVEVNMQEQVFKALKPHKNITTLVITGFKGKTFPDWMGDFTLENLETLSINNILDMHSLPEGLQNLPKLKSLNLCKLAYLTSVPDWLVKITSLSRLLIHSCPRISMLPITIQEMGNLSFLHIKNCPELEMRCEKDNGEDWRKISHIPNVLLG